MLRDVSGRELLLDSWLFSVRCMAITDAGDGFESDSEREESSDEEDDAETLKQQQRTAKPISRHSTRRSSQQQQISENKGSYFVCYYGMLKKLA
jgi:hypothetical protein